MMTPFIPLALLAAATPSADYESITGDLQEEYAARLVREGRARADLWYWSQALRSLPALLSYSRAYPSRGRRFATAAIVIGVLVAMLAGKDMLDRLLDAIRPGMPLPAWLYFVLNWMVAAAFGAVLAQIVRQHPVRLALLGSSALVAAFALPALALGPPISAPAWLLLLGSVPAMSAGAATVHAFHQR